MQLDLQETKLIAAALEMMVRLVRDDGSMSKAEREEVRTVAERIKRKFHNAIFCAGRTTILTPDGALNPNGEDIDGRDIFSGRVKLT